MESRQSENWDFYQCNVNDEHSFVLVDLSLFEQAPISDYGHLHWLWIKLLYPDDRGLSTEREFATLSAYEEVASKALTQSGLIYAGRITGQSRREFYFYSKESQSIQDYLATTISQFSEYQFQIGSKEDPQWAHYRELLYPGPNGLDQISQRRETQNEGT